MRIRSQNDVENRHGYALLAVLVIIVLLTLASYQYSELMYAELHASDSSLRALQAKAMADSGIHYAAALLSDPNSFTGTLNSNPYSNSTAFQGIQAFNDQVTGRIGRFSILAPVDPDNNTTGQTFLYGVTDESGKININALIKVDSTGQVAHDTLMKLPNMTEEIADAIIDWIDGDDDPRPSGAESDYYSALTPPYRCKNGPLDTLEELLMVRGVTAQLLFGSDTNRNGIQDPGEDTGSGWTAGWAAYLTVYSRERNVDADGNPRTFLNDSNLQTQHDTLTQSLGQALADFVSLYRTQTDTPASSTTATMSTAGGNTVVRVTVAQKSTPATAQQISDKVSSVLKDTNSKGKTLSSRYELIGASCSWTVGTGRNQQTVTLASPLNDKNQLGTLLPLLLDKTSTQQAAELPGRVNLLTAPQTVLASLPGLTDSDVTAIMQVRPDMTQGAPTDTIFQTPAWLITEANISTSKMQTLERYVTSRTMVYRVQSLGQFDQGGPFARVEAVIDTNNGQPRIVMYRDLTMFGRGYSVTQSQ